MAKILYGVCGEGSGHASRALVLINFLKSKGHEVKILSYDTGFEVLRKYYKVEKIIGPRFVYKHNKVQYFSTILKNIKITSKSARPIEKALKIAKTFEPDLIITDFEPISCLVANIKKIPLISIDNQHLITNTKIEYPPKYKNDAMAAKAVIKLFIHKANAYLVTNFFSIKTLNAKTFIVPPILRQQIFNIKTKEDDFVLVYSTSNFNDITAQLKEINKKFVIYGMNKEEIDKNLIFKLPSQEGFLRDLSNCQAVISSSGFTLLTEALYLKKPFLAMPVEKQFEQVINAFYLEKLGYGKYWDNLDKEKIESFLFNIEKYKKNLKNYQPQNNDKLFAKLDELINKYTI